MQQVHVRIRQYCSRLARLCVTGVAFGSLAACQAINEPNTASPVVTASPTPVPMLAVVTPTPPGQGEAPATTPASAAPQPAPAATAPAATPGSYVVQAGDTLYAIAVRYRVSVQALMTANAITDPASIQVGQVLVIPERTTP